MLWEKSLQWNYELQIIIVKFSSNRQISVSIFVQPSSFWRKLPDIRRRYHQYDGDNLFILSNSIFVFAIVDDKNNIMWRRHKFTTEKNKKPSCRYDSRR